MRLLSRILLLLCLLPLYAQAAIDPALLKPLAGDDSEARVAAVGQLAALATPEAARVLQALQAETLYATPGGDVLIVDGGKALVLDGGYCGDTTVPMRLPLVTDFGRKAGVCRACPQQKEKKPAPEDGGA